MVVFDTFTRRPGFARLLAWGLLTGSSAETISPTSSAPSRGGRRDGRSVSREAPEATGDAAAMITTLLISSVLGFNLLRPLLTSAFKWGADEDRLLRDQLVRAMVGLPGARLSPSSAVKR